MKLTLYGRSHCGLCDQMARVLRESGLAFEEIDVDSDPALAERYGRLVPVLLAPGGGEICHYRLDDATLQAARAALR